MTEVPASFGKYYLTEKLAAGGMAEIYLAKLVGPGGFEKLLVIKQIHPRLSGQRHFVDLFVAEAKILVGLVHGNIVPVYELGVIGDTYYIAMEYIDGPSLYRLTEQLRLTGRPMEPALAAHVTTKILDGLDYAHRKGEGIIHRDLSGRNVMISRDGEVKLVDFGIAVTLGDPGDAAGDTPAGSFPYMSPEQVRREALTGQSDLFSAGILLWEMLSGERLFARPDAAATLRAVTDAEIVPPSVHNPAVPGRLDELVMKALQRDQAQRWQTAAEMLAALHRYLYSLEETPGPRELGRLVARLCPPTARRRPTESDAAPVAVAPTMAPPGGPSTAVIPRDAAIRQQSFATHVELAGLLHVTSASADSGEPSGDAVTAVVEGREDRSGEARASEGREGREGSGSGGGEGRDGGDPAAGTAGPSPSAEHTAALPRRPSLSASAPPVASSSAPASKPPSKPLSSPPSSPPGETSAAGAAPSGPPRLRASTPAPPVPEAPLMYPRAAGAEAVAAIERSAPHHAALPRPPRRRAAVIASVLLLAAAGAVTATVLRRGPEVPALALADEGEHSRDDSGGTRSSPPGPGLPGVQRHVLSDDQVDGAGAGEPGTGLRGDEAMAAARDAGPRQDAGLLPDARRPPLPRGDARPAPADARPAPADARPAPADARRPDARPVPPPPIDARPVPDARPIPADARPVPDARPPVPDARPLPRPDAQKPEPRAGAPAQIKVGANPWGEVFLDGKPAGRTPTTLTVSPGHHEVEVAFPVGERPRRETYRLDLGAGETRSVLADFTR